MTESIYAAALRLTNEKRAAAILTADPEQLWDAYVAVEDALQIVEPLEVKINRLLGSS